MRADCTPPLRFGQAIQASSLALRVKRAATMIGIDVSKIKREDWEVVEYLRNNEAEAFKNFKKLARAKKKG